MMIYHENSFEELSKNNHIWQGLWYNKATPKAEQYSHPTLSHTLLIVGLRVSGCLFEISWGMTTKYQELDAKLSLRNLDLFVCMLRVGTVIQNSLHRRDW